MLAIAENEAFQPLEWDDRERMLPRENRTYDTLVEVIDWKSGTVLAERRFDSTLGPIHAGGFLLEPFVGSGGEQQFRVLQLTLVRE